MTVNEHKIDKRARDILKSLIERYIQSGEPVGSKTLSEKAGLQLSAASIRNVLADLETAGFLHSPHTSAGRVPTAKGYRLFVDNLLTIQPLTSTDFKKLQRELTPDINMSTPDLLSKASLWVSQLTSLAGIVTVPKRKSIVLSHLEFLPLSDNRILTVLVLNNREIQNKIIYTHKIYTASELQQASNYLNSHFGGKDLTEIKKKLKDQMRADKKEINQLLQDAILSTEPDQSDFVLNGELNLLDSSLNHEDFSSHRNRLREIFEAFNQKQDILYLLEQCIKAADVQIYIGEESGFAPLGDYSLISVPYKMDNQIVGVLAVIGPTRMAYDKIIPAVDMTAKLLGAALNQIK